LPDGRGWGGARVGWGAVAGRGPSQGGAGALAPAGTGARQRWSAEGAADARAAASGALPATLPLYLFESLDKPVDLPRASSFADYLRRGGDVAYVIVGLGAVGLVLVLLRVLILSMNAGAPDGVLAAVAPLFRAGRHDEALARVRAARGSAARVVEAMLPQLGHGA